MKANGKLANAGKMKEERVKRYRELMELVEEHKKNDIKIKPIWKEMLLKSIY